MEKYGGTTIDEYVTRVANELPIDAVGFWQLLSDKKWFNLSDLEFKEYAKKCMVYMMKIGAVPVFGGKGTSFYWIETDKFGSNAERISDNIINEWEETKNDKGIDVMWGLGGVWFALPRKNSPNYVKLLNKPK